MVIEDGIVISEDMDNRLYEIYTSLPLLSFQVDSVLYIGFQDELRQVTISFNDGYIRIKY